MGLIDDKKLVAIGPTNYRGGPWGGRSGARRRTRVQPSRHEAVDRRQPGAEVGSTSIRVGRVAGRKVEYVARRDDRAAVDGFPVSHGGKQYLTRLTQAARAGAYARPLPRYREPGGNGLTGDPVGRRYGKKPARYSAATRVLADHFSTSRRNSRRAAGWAANTARS